MAKNPIYQNGPFWVSAEVYGSGYFKAKSKGYAVNKNTGTHSVRVAVIGFSGEAGLRKAITEADKRAKENANAV